MCGVTVIVVPAEAYPAKLVVATVLEALTLVKGASAVLESDPVALSLTRIFGAETTLAWPVVARARTTALMTPASMTVPFRPVPGVMVRAPAEFDVLRPNWLKASHWVLGPTLMPEISTPNEKLSVVSSVTSVTSTMTWGRRLSSIRMSCSYTCWTAGGATTIRVFVLGSAVTMASLRRLIWAPA